MRQKWFPIGQTVPYVEYQRTEDMLGYFALEAGATGSEIERWGVGVVQDIDRPRPCLSGWRTSTMTERSRALRQPARRSAASSTRSSELSSAA